MLLFIRLISSDEIIGHSEPLYLMVLDDIESIIDYVPIEHRFNNKSLQTILVIRISMQRR